MCTPVHCVYTCLLCVHLSTVCTSVTQVKDVRLPVQLQRAMAAEAEAAREARAKVGQEEGCLGSKLN